MTRPTLANAPPHFRLERWRTSTNTTTRVVITTVERMTLTQFGAPSFSQTCLMISLANTEAVEAGYDEALLLDVDGYVAEGAGENLFIVKNGVIYTPDLSAGALNGITRNTIFAIARDLGLEIKEKRITRDEVYIADEAFFTGTAAEVTAVRAIGPHSYTPGRITETLMTGYDALVRQSVAEVARITG